MQTILTTVAVSRCVRKCVKLYQQVHCAFCQLHFSASTTFPLTMEVKLLHSTFRTNTENRVCLGLLMSTFLPIQ